jgi:hypothetical protein
MCKLKSNGKVATGKFRIILGPGCRGEWFDGAKAKWLSGIR